MTRTRLQDKLMVGGRLHCPLTCGCCHPTSHDHPHDSDPPAYRQQHAHTILRPRQDETLCKCRAAVQGQAPCRVHGQASVRGAHLHLLVGGQGTVPGRLAGVHSPCAGDHGHGRWAADRGRRRPCSSALGLHPCVPTPHAWLARGVSSGVPGVCWAWLCSCGGVHT